MRVRVEIEYTATPPKKELENLGQAGSELTNAPQSVSVRPSETSVRPTLVLEFTMKTQAQYKVVNFIWDTAFVTS